MLTSGIAPAYLTSNCCTVLGLKPVNHGRTRECQDPVELGKFVCVWVGGWVDVGVG